MICPNCKVHSVRKSEDDNGKDVLKCHLCSREYQLDDTNHLRPTAAAITHTAAILTPAPVEPETMKKAVAIAEKSLERDAPQKPKRGGKHLSPAQRADIIRRLKAGEEVKVLAAEYKVTGWAIYLIRKKLGIHGSMKSRHAGVNKPVRPAADIEPKSNRHKQTVVFDNQHRGNLALQLLRLKRGELKPQTTKTVIQRYKGMLEYDLGRAQKQVRDTKRNLAAVNGALHELEVIESGQKAVFEKVLAMVE